MPYFAFQNGWNPPSVYNEFAFASPVDLVSVLKCGCRVSDEYYYTRKLGGDRQHYCLPAYTVKVVEDHDNGD